MGVTWDRWFGSQGGWKEIFHGGLGVGRSGRWGGGGRSVCRGLVWTVGWVYGGDGEAVGGGLIPITEWTVRLPCRAPNSDANPRLGTDIPLSNGAKCARSEDRNDLRCEAGMVSSQRSEYGREREIGRPDQRSAGHLEPARLKRRRAGLTCPTSCLGTAASLLASTAR